MSFIQRPVNGLLLPGLAARRTCLAASHSPRHLSPQRRTFFREAVSTTVDSAASVFTAIHAAGVPWWATIPLVAVGVNMAVRLPTQMYMQRMQRTRAALRPLVNAWSSRHGQMAATQTSMLARSAHVARASERSRRRLYRAWGVPLWKTLIPLATMVPFAIMSGALRHLSGVGGVPEAAVPSGDVLGGKTLTDSMQAAGETLSATSVADSLSTGGLLWFENLMMADPYAGLPVICSLLLAANIYSRMTVAQWRKALLEHRPGEPWTQRLARGVVRISLFIPMFPLFCTHLPAAVLLYWTANFSMQLFNVNFVQKMYPEKKLDLVWQPQKSRQESYITRQSIDNQKGRPRV